MVHERQAAGPREVISVRGLWAGYDGEVVLQDVNLSVEEGDFVGLIGPNGGGKTTFLKVLLGLHPPLRGEVRVLGMEVKEGRRYVGYVPQVVEFDREFPIQVWDVVRMGRLGRRGLLRRFTREDDEAVAELLRQVGMWEHRDRLFGELSGGQRQRVYIARALAQEPKILLLDEPLASVDSEMRTSIYDLLQRLNAEQGITILMVSHDVGAISSYVKTVGCLNRRLIYHASKEITAEMLKEGYVCPVDLIAHGLPHRVFASHREEGR
ncbi:MAG: metal ABC transporter ATP-binding protein [Anaerolineae bacterium]